MTHNGQIIIHLIIYLSVLFINGFEIDFYPK